MFVAALFTVAKIWKQCRCPSVDELTRIHKHTHTHTHTQEYLHSHKNDEIMTFETILMDLEGIMLSKMCQTKKDQYHMSSLINEI